MSLIKVLIRFKPSIGVASGCCCALASAQSYRWFGLDYKQAVAYTLVLVGLFWNGAGGLTLALVGQVQWDWLPVLLFASLVGGYLGAHWALLKGNLWVKRSFEIVTIFTGFSLLWRGIS